MIDTTGLDNAAVLAALYNGSRPLGMGHLHAIYTSPQPTGIATEFRGDRPPQSGIGETPD